MPPMSAAASTRSSKPGSDPERGSRLGVERSEQHRRRRRQDAGEHPHDRRHPLDVDARQSGRVGVGGRRPDGQPVLRPVQEERQRDDQDGDHHDDRQLRTLYHQTPDPPRPGERRRVGPNLGDLRKDQLEEEQQLRGTDERDEKDHAWRREESAHDDQLERGPDQGADDDADGERQPERDVPVDHEPVQQRGREPAHLADGEVDDSRRPEDEDDADRHHAIGQSGDGARGDDLLRGSRRRAASPSTSASRGTRRGRGRRVRPARRSSPRSGSRPSP